MARPVKWLIPLSTVLVVFAVEGFHSHVVARHAYGLTSGSRFTWVLVFIGLLWLASYASGLPDESDRLGRATLRAGGATGAAALVISVIQLFNGAQLLPRFVVFASPIVLVPVFVGVSILNAASERRRAAQDRVLAVVVDEEAVRLRTEVAGRVERPSLLVGTIDPEEVVPATAGDEPLLRVFTARASNMLVLDRAAQGCDEVVAQAAKLHSRGARIRTLSMFYDEWLGKLPISELERISLLFDINEIHHPIYARTKRFLDVAIASVGMVGLLLAAPAVALFDLAGNRGPLLYRQPRVGKDGVIFTIYKFRTMPPVRIGTSEPAWTAKDDPRLGRVGRTLRRLHVDELPQMWNVLRRDLSIVGPRPEQPHYVAQLSEKIPFYELRHLVRPGITGWAQVKYDYGATELDAWEKLQFEFFYLRHQSLGLDLRILGRTLRTVFEHDGR